MTSLNNKIREFLVILVILISIISLFSIIINAADPGHNASDIGPGIFETGSYTFPFNLIINNNLTISNSTAYFGLGTSTPSRTLDVRGIGNFSASLYVDNSSLVNTWLYNQTLTAFYYNQSDNSQLLFNYNHTTNANNTYLYPAYGSFWINQTSNYLQINASTLAGITNESSSYAPIKFGYNESTSYQQFWFNQSLASFNQYGTFWNNQTSPYQSLFYNQSTGTFNQYGIWWYNQSLSTATSIFNKSSSNIFLNDLFNFLGLGVTASGAKLHINISNNTGGSDALPDALLITKAGINVNATTLLILNGTSGNLGIGLSNPSQKLDVRGIINASGEIYANNQTPLSINSYNFTLASMPFYNITYVRLDNETLGNHTKFVENNYLKFFYNQSLGTQNSFGQFWYNMSTPLLSMSNTWTVQQTFNVNTIITNATINNNLDVLGNITTNNITIFGNLILNKITSTSFLGTDSNGNAVARNNESSLYLQLNASTYAFALTNESSKYLQINSSSVIYLYNQSLST